MITTCPCCGSRLTRWVKDLLNGIRWRRCADRACRYQEALTVRTGRGGESCDD